MDRLKEIEKEIELLNLEKQDILEFLEQDTKEKVKTEVSVSAWFFADVKIKTTLDLNKKKEEVIADAYHKLEEIISTELKDEDLELCLTIDGMTNINKNIDEIEITISDKNDDILIEGKFKER